MTNNKKKKNRPPPFVREPEVATRSSLSEKGGVHKIIIGVDFGTTFTGVSWVSTEGADGKTFDDVHCIRDWPGSSGVASKTPSRLAYATENQSTTVSNAWGNEVKEKMTSYGWMKLLLDPTASSKYDDPSLASSEGIGVLQKPAHKSPVEICADFLTEIAKHAYGSLEKRLTKEVLDATPIETWFTVPAVWSDKAKSDTLQAAKVAFRQTGLFFHPDSQIFMIREPEAAAIAIMAYLTKGGSQQQIQAGDNIMILDCGGGTVDIVSYKTIATVPKLEFEELVVGTGAKCGSTYIDREMIKWMTAEFGPAYTTLSWDKRGPAGVFMQKFEVHKRGFQSAASNTTYEMTLVMRDVDSKHYDEDNCEVVLKHSDLKQMFDTVVNKIMALLQSQLDAISGQNASIKTLLLAGGFGDSKYLNEKLRAYCSGMGIRLICPEEPQSAIVRGAALSGLHSIQPTSRRARMHYGIAVSQPFDAARHDNKDMYHTLWDGMARADNQMSWKLNKGAVVNESTTIDFELSSIVAEHDLATAPYEAVVYCSELDDPPRKSYSPGCQKLGVITLNFSEIDLTGFKLKGLQGVTSRRVVAHYVVSFGDRCGLLCFAAYVNGQEVGKRTITFDGQASGNNSQQNMDDETKPNAPPCAPQ